MKNLFRISIIIPVYNVEKYITECLQSVMRQTYKGPMECLVIDDCGTDKSIAIAEQLIADYNGPISFRILHHNHNRGLSAARNTGTGAAIGDYIYYLDSDDYIADDCIETLAKPLQRRVYDMVIGDFKMFGVRQSATWLLEEQEEILDNCTAFASYAERQLYIMAWNKLYKLNFLKKYRITFLEGQLHEDELWTYKIMCAIESIDIIHQITYFYRVRENSIATNRANAEKKLTAYFDTLSYIQKNPYPVDISYIKCILYYWNFYLRISFDNNFNFFDQYRALRSTCLYNPYNLYKQKLITFRQLMREIHFLLPIKLGYWHLKACNYKRKIMQ